MSSNSKRRKVIVGPKSQAKHDRGSVFERLGNQDGEKPKKWKDSVEVKPKSKKHSQKPGNDDSGHMKKSKIPSKSDVPLPVKKSKDVHRSERQKSDYSDSKKEHRVKVNKRTEAPKDTVTPEPVKSHTKRKIDSAEHTQRIHKMENLIIEKRVSPSSSSRDRSRSTSCCSVRSRKKMKKSISKHESPGISIDRYHKYQSKSPQPQVRSGKYKERGRSREPKRKHDFHAKPKMTHEVTSQRYDVKAQEIDAGEHQPVLKQKRVPKHGKPEKGTKKDTVLPEKRSSKIKQVKSSSNRERSVERSSPCTYEESSDEQYSKPEVHHKSTKKVARKQTERDIKRDYISDDEPQKPKRRKYNDQSPVNSRKKTSHTKIHSSGDGEAKGSGSSHYVKKDTTVKYESSKTKHKDGGSVLKKKHQKDYSSQKTYNSDFSSTSKHSQVENSDDFFAHSDADQQLLSSDSFIDTKEAKKRMKAKKKRKKEAELSPDKGSFADFGGKHAKQTKKLVKKRKRKVEDKGMSFSESAVEEPIEKDHTIQDNAIKNKKKRDGYNPSVSKTNEPRRQHGDREPHAQKQSNDRDSTPVQSQSKPLSIHSRKTSIHLKERNYMHGSHKQPETTKSKPLKYIDTKHSSKDLRYSPDHKESQYVKSKRSSGHHSSDRDPDRKVIEWQRTQNVRDIPTTRDEIPPRPHAHPSPHSFSSDHHSDQHRMTGKFIPQRKMLLEPDYLYQPKPPPEVFHGGHIQERWERKSDGRPVPPSRGAHPFTSDRNYVRPTYPQPHVKVKSTYTEKGKYHETDKYHSERKYAGKERTDPLHRGSSKDHKYSIVCEEGKERRIRSGSRDSRSSSQHGRALKGKVRSHNVIAQKLSPRHSSSSADRGEYRSSGRKSKLVAEPGDANRGHHALNKRVPHEYRINESFNQTKDKKYIKEQISESLHSQAGDRPPKLDDVYRGRKVQRPPIKRHGNAIEQGSRRSTSSHSSHGHDYTHKKRNESPRTTATKSRRKPRGSSHDTSKARSALSTGSQQVKDKKKKDEISDNELNLLMENENQTAPQTSEKSEMVEVDWNDLPKPAEANSSGAAKEHSSVLKKFSPYNILLKTGISTELLPPYLLKKIDDIYGQNEDPSLQGTDSDMKASDENSGSNSPPTIKDILQGGLHSYADEKIRKKLLGYNPRYRHPLIPPFLINAKTYSASMKNYMLGSKLAIEAT